MTVPSPSAMHDATEAPTHLQTDVRAQVVILAVSFMGIAAAWTYSVLLMTCWVMLALVITILGAATTLSPVILLRLIFIILGLQVGSSAWRRILLARCQATDGCADQLRQC